MTRNIFQENPRYDSLSSPFKSIKDFIESDHEGLGRNEGEVLDGTTFTALGRVSYRRGIQVLRAGDLNLIAGRTTPVQSINSAESFSCFFAMPFIGGFKTKEGKGVTEVAAGDIYLNQRYSGPSTMGYLSSLFVALDPRRLDRTMRSVGRGETIDMLPTSITVKGASSDSGLVGTRKMWKLLSFIDNLYDEDESIPSCVGLDDQFYRLLSFALLEANNRLEKVRRHWSKSFSDWKNPLDELVDYIHVNSHLGLTLTDLEEQSHYSARHLQNLFKEKFDCTPMQFVRRQRLTSAMEKLQTADYDATVTSIGRDCGYRFTSNFTTDFHRQFGVTPSTVLRASRGG